MPGQPNERSVARAPGVEASTPRVRRTVAGRPDTPVQVLRRLARDADARVREAVAENPACPPAVLVGLIGDPTFGVRFGALFHPNADRRVRLAASESPDDDIRRLLAETEPLDESIRSRLIADPAPAVRAGMAAQTTDRQTLAVLVRDPDPDVRQGAAQNERLTADQRHSLARDRSAAVRAVLVQSGELEPEDLLVLARDRSVTVRWFLATAPTTPRTVLELLRADPADEVRIQARMNLGEFPEAATDRRPRPRAT